MFSVLAVMAIVAAMVAAMAMPAFAHVAPDHQHLLTTASGNQVTVGPNVCGDTQNDQGFQQFHHNVHGDTVHGTTPVQEAFSNNDVSLSGGRCPTQTS